jgi:hypothetical protein
MKTLLRANQWRPKPAHQAWIVALTVCAAVLAGCARKEEPAASSATPTVSTNATVARGVDFQRITGRWQRADGDYLLDIKSADAEGNLAAAYYNPSPINVARAVVVSDSEGLRVVVELKDVNYPGCVYRLKYDGQVDQLYGTYYQAAMDETFNVTFARVK